MNGKKILLFVIALIIIAIIIVSNQLSNKKPSEETLKMFGKPVSSVVIKDASGVVTLRKKGDVWMVSSGANVTNSVTADQPVGAATVSMAEFSTDSASITVALEKIESITKSTLSSDNPEKQTLFEVDSAKGTFVETFDQSGKSLGAVYIGKNGPDWNSNYVRAKNSNNVYLVPGGVKYSFFTDITRWRDKSILNFDQATVKAISLVNKTGDTVTMTQDSAASWNISVPLQAPAKSDVVNSMLSTLSRLNTAEFYNEIPADSVSGFGDPELTVTVNLPGGIKTVVFGKKDANNRYFTRTNGKETTFLVNDPDFNNINKDFTALNADTTLLKPARAAKKAAKK
jgi:hypothetical protein